MSDPLSRKYQASIRRVWTVKREPHSNLLTVRLECDHVLVCSDSILAGWMFCMDCFKDGLND